MLTFPTIADGTGNMYKPLLDNKIQFYKISIPYESLGGSDTGKLSIYKYNGSLILLSTYNLGDSEILSFGFKMYEDSKYKIIESVGLFLTTESHFSVY